MSAKQQTPLTPIELSAFCSQMAMILRSGIPEREGLCIMRDDASDDATFALMNELAEQSEMGFPFSHVLRESGVFPRYMVDMVEVGECSGKLDEVLDALTEYYERERAIKASVKNAVAYPLIMLALMMVVIAVLSIKVLPIFSQVFSQLGVQTAAFAGGILRLGSILGNISLFIVVALAIVAVVSIGLQTTSSGTEKLGALLSKLPFTKNISLKIATGRFANSMALMLSSGMDTDRALEMTAKLVNHAVMRQRVDECGRLIAEGATFAEAISKSKALSGLYARMIAVGFKTGKVDAVFEKLAIECQEEIDADLARIVGIIEPSLVAVLSIVVGFILLSVMLPLMGIMSSIG